MFKLLALGQDFGDVLTILTFSGQISRQCVNISIAMDGIVEPEESFNVVLETSDPAVILGTAQVLIADSDSKLVYLVFFIGMDLCVQFLYIELAIYNNIKMDTQLKYNILTDRL